MQVGKLPKNNMNADDWKVLEKDYHDRVASSYEELCKLNRPLSILNNDQRVRYLWGLFEQTSKSSILDIGCGTGINLIPLSKLGAWVIGIDLSVEMVKIAKRKCPNCNVVVGDMENLPFDIASISLTYCMASLHHVPHPAKAIEEQIRVTTNHGYAYFEEPLNNALFDLVRKIAKVQLFQRSPCESAFYESDLTRCFKDKTKLIRKKGYKVFFTMLLADRVNNEVIGKFVFRIDESLSRIPYLQRFLSNCFFVLRK